MKNEIDKSQSGKSAPSKEADKQSKKDLGSVSGGSSEDKSKSR